jgi:single-strand DNA-binding protein
MAFAKAMIIGNLGRDPEMRYLPSGRPVTEFSVAVSHSKPDGNGGWVDEGTDWYRVTVWGDRAERTAEQFRKGNKVFVEGRFRTREFEGKDGQKRTALEITADNVISLDARVRNDDEGGSFAGASGASGAGSSGGFSGGASSGGGQGNAPAVRPTRSAPQAQPPDDLDDLPF